MEAGLQVLLNKQADGEDVRCGGVNELTGFGGYKISFVYRFWGWRQTSPHAIDFALSEHPGGCI
ncbi:MAG: hypothetical protein FWF54_09515 [Candidatus Azobacteroides sp.]|nr:hypothetical protein [Candidatus Azobacteroides sp.]